MGDRLTPLHSNKLCLYNTISYLPLSFYLLNLIKSLPTKKNKNVLKFSGHSIRDGSKIPAETGLGNKFYSLSKVKIF